LRHSGSDGRFLWLPGIREVKGIISVEELARRCGITRFRRMDLAFHGSVGVGLAAGPNPDDTVDVGDWCRPVLLDGQPTLLVLPATSEGEGVRRWRIVDRDIVKEY